MRVTSILPAFRLVLAGFLAGLLGNAQGVYTRTEVDASGHRVDSGSTDIVGKSGNTELSHSINGRIVPLEKVEERVLHEDASGKTVERLIQRFDPTGTSVTSVREVIDEQKKPGGASVTTRTVYAGDINGHMQVQQRTSTQTQKSGNVESSETVVERSNINGGFEPASRQRVEKVKNGDGYQESVTTYLPTQNGSFAPAVKLSKSVTKANGQTTENAAEYEIGPAGELRLHSQKVRNTVKRPDGSEEVQFQIYGQAVAGIAGSFDSNQLKLMEQQHIERRKTSGDTVVETVEVQRPSVSDPSRLGPLKQISETFCKGKCDKPDQPE